MASEWAAVPFSGIINTFDGTESFGTDRTFGILNHSWKIGLIGLVVFLSLVIIFAIADRLVRTYKAGKGKSNPLVQQFTTQSAPESSGEPNTSTKRQSGNSEAWKWPTIRNLLSRSSPTSHSVDTEMQVPETALRLPEPRRNASRFTPRASTAFEEHLERSLAARFGQQSDAGLDSPIVITGIAPTDPSASLTDSPATLEPVTLRSDGYEDFESGPPPLYESHQYDEIVIDGFSQHEPPVYGSDVTDEEAITAWCRREAESRGTTPLHGP